LSESAEFFKKTALKFFIFRHIYQNVSFFSYDFTPNIQAILPVLTGPKKCCTFEPENKGNKEFFEILVRRFFSQVSLFKGAGTLFRTVKFSKKQWFVCEVRPAYNRLIKKGKII
jgi:hypothetical protein